jgi:hypothetical protein
MKMVLRVLMKKMIMTMPEGVESTGGDSDGVPPL